MASVSIDQIMGWVVALVGGGGVVKLAELRARRLGAAASAKAREPADLIRAAGELQQVLTDGGKELVGAFIGEFRFLRGEVQDLRGKVDECETSHAACRSEVSTLNARLDESARDRAELKASLERLMAEPPASY